MMGRFGILAEVFSRCLLDLVRCSNEVFAYLVVSLNRSHTVAGGIFCCQPRLDALKSVYRTVKFFDCVGKYPFL